MLYDYAHSNPFVPSEEIRLSQRDKDVLRRLAEEIGRAGVSPSRLERTVLWTDLNGLDSQRPMVLIDGVCWNELSSASELALESAHPWARDQEQALRRVLYQWKHFACDMIVNDWIASPLAVHSTGFGITEDADAADFDDGGVVSKRYHTQIRDLEDIAAIQNPVVTHDEKASQFRYDAMCDTYGGILPVKQTGLSQVWFSPWDCLVRWWGVSEALMDFALRPDFVHAAVGRVVDAWISELDQLVRQDLLSPDCGVTRIGNGGYGCTGDLPVEERVPTIVLPSSMWGSSHAHIFAEVSPEMYWEYALSHELRWLSRWGLTYYGDSEPLDGKAAMLRRIPNLRKVSISSWCDYRRAVEAYGRDYVLSFKPSPAIFADPTWDADHARKALRAFLDVAGGECHVEVILKDISTVRRDPVRLRDWSAIAMEEVTRHA